MGEATDTLALPREAARPRILTAALSLAAAGVVVKFAGLSKEIVLAATFGRSDAMDALLAALLIPNLLVNLLAESMNQALIPTLIRVRLLQGHGRAQELLSSSMLSLVVLSGGACAVMALLAHALLPLMASGFQTAKLRLSIHLFYVLLPMVLLSGIASNCTAVLNTVERFTFPALVPIVIPVSIIAFSLMLHAALGIWAVALATVFGSAVHSAAMARAMRSSGYTFRLRWYGRTMALREVVHQYGVVFLSSIVASAGLLVDQAMAATMPTGSVSALAYGTRYAAVVMTLLAGAISSAVVPYFSTLVAQGDWSDCRRTVRLWARRMAFISAPLAIALIFASHWLVRLTLQHGAFGRPDTAAVAPVLAMYAIQIPFFVVSRVFYRFIVAMRRSDLVLYCGVINLVLDVMLNLILMHWMGVAGIALATSLWSISTCGLFWFWTRRLLARAEAQP